MRVLLLTDADVFAGTERHILDLAQRLKNLGEDVCIGCPSPSPLASGALEAGVDVINLQKRGRLGVGVIMQLRRLLRSGGVQVIHAHNGRTALQAAIAAQIGRCGKLVVTQHFLIPNRTKRKGIRGMLSVTVHRYIARRLSKYIAISEAVRLAMIERQDCPVEQVITILNGLVDPLERTAHPTQLTREVLKIPQRALLIVCVARLEPEKNHAVLIDAMSIVAKRNPKCTCLIAGDGTERANLEIKVREHKLESVVRFVGFRSDIPSLISASDLFVLPSVAEPFGLVLLEAMALSRPVIAMNSGGPAEIVEHNLTGVLVDPGDALGLADAISRLCLDSSSRTKLGMCGRKRFEERFSADRMAEQTAEVYWSVFEDSSVCT